MLKFSRYFVGILFIISGLIKVNDPTGFAIKLEEYFVVFGMEWLSFAAVTLSVLICAFEVVLGVALLVGIKPKFVAWCLLLMIIFFTWLTGYSAITNKVTDCGCFGDAIKLTPWQSFSKDIVLLILILIIFIKRKVIQPAFSNKISNTILVGTSVLSILLGVYCLYYLPVIDFLPYKVGNNLPALMQIPEGAPRDSFETKMYYQKNGETKEFNLQNYPWQDTTWKWVRTENVLIKEGFRPKIKDLRISDADGNEYTDDIIQNSEYQLIVVAYDLKHTRVPVYEKLDTLALTLERIHKIRTIGLTATSAEETEYYRHELNTPFDFYFCDATTLKTMVRSNPGVLLLKNGVVINKWSACSLPEYNKLVQYLQN
jgi:uncharacterized membrane protein YphA (DoxX/SURF4 family)